MGGARSCDHCNCKGHHTTEAHEQARTNPCTGLSRPGVVERMTAAELAIHAAPCCCPGCELCRGS